MEGVRNPDVLLIKKRGGERSPPSSESPQARPTLKFLSFPPILRLRSPSPVNCGELASNKRMVGVGLTNVGKEEKEEVSGSVKRRGEGGYARGVWTIDDTAFSSSSSEITGCGMMGRARDCLHTQTNSRPFDFDLPRARWERATFGMASEGDVAVLRVCVVENRDGGRRARRSGRGDKGMGPQAQ